MAKRKIAVLGSGVGSMSAVFELLKASADVDVTVYQMGWRAGGKGASGRSLKPGKGLRIEEHGLHMWSGLYDNAFRIMRETYDALGRPKGAPLATCFEAFEKHSSIVLYEEYKGKWLPWVVEVPTNDELPGDPDAKMELSLWDYVGEAVQLIFGQAGKGDSPLAWLTRLVMTVVAKVVLGLAGALYSLLRALHLGWIVEEILLLVLGVFMAAFWLFARGRLDDDELRRAWMVANFGYANLRGALRCRVLTRGMDYLDELDYREWLGKYMHDDRIAGRSLTLDGPLAYFLYDAQFSYLDGDLGRPDIGAGSSLRTVIRMAFTWKGAILWRMQAAMGDVVFGPFYEVLKAKGVKFKFFHQVRSLHLNADKSAVASIEGIVQAEVKSGSYEPLFDVKGLPCWPSEPFWDQLVDGEQLKAKGVDFESYCFKGGKPFSLVAGRDFDEIIFGVPVGCIPYVAGELVEASPRWRNLVDTLKTVRTQATQVWMKEPMGELGAAGSDQPLMVTYHPTPMNTIADMSFLTEREAWPAAKGRYPLSQYYLCGPLFEAAPPAPTPVGPKNTCEQLEQGPAEKQVLENVETLFGSLISPIFPEATLPPRTPGAPLDWNLLIDDGVPERDGKARLAAQYIRANVSPSERFTLTNKGSSKFRIKPGESGFKNVKLAGDWTDNTFNLANVEATVMSGMLCSQAICGLPKNEDIVGLGFGSTPRR